MGFGFNGHDRRRFQLRISLSAWHCKSSREPWIVAIPQVAVVACAMHRLQAELGLGGSAGSRSPRSQPVLAHSHISDFQLSASMKSLAEIHTQSAPLTPTLSKWGRFDGRCRRHHDLALLSSRLFLIGPKRSSHVCSPYMPQYRPGSLGSVSSACMHQTAFDDLSSWSTSSPVGDTLSPTR